MRGNPELSNRYSGRHPEKEPVERAFRYIEQTAKLIENLKELPQDADEAAINAVLASYRKLWADSEDTNDDFHRNIFRFLDQLEKKSAEVRGFRAYSRERQETEIKEKTGVTPRYLEEIVYDPFGVTLFMDQKFFNLSAQRKKLEGFHTANSIFSFVKVPKEQKPMRDPDPDALLKLILGIREEPPPSTFDAKKAAKDTARHERVHNIVGRLFLGQTRNPSKVVQSRFKNYSSIIDSGTEEDFKAIKNESKILLIKTNVRFILRSVQEELLASTESPLRSEIDTITDELKKLKSPEEIFDFLCKCFSTAGSQVLACAHYLEEFSNHTNASIRKYAQETLQQLIHTFNASALQIIKAATIAKERKDETVFSEMQAACAILKPDQYHLIDLYFARKK